MLELATFAANFLAFALWHAADPRRRPPRLREVAPAWSLASRWGAAALVLLGIAAWTQLEGVAAALLVVLTMFSTAATLFVLAVPVFPRLTWGAALACLPSVPLLSWLGGLGG